MCPDYPLATFVQEQQAHSERHGQEVVNRGYRGRAEHRLQFRDVQEDGSDHEREEDCWEKVDVASRATEKRRMLEY